MSHRAPDVDLPPTRIDSVSSTPASSPGPAIRRSPMTRAAQIPPRLLRGVRTELTKLSWRNPLFWLAVPLSILIPVGINYGLVFTAWGFGGFLLALLAGKVHDATGSFAFAYYCSAGLLVVAAVATLLMRPPHQLEEEPAV